MKRLFVLYGIYLIARIMQGSTNAISSAVMAGLSKFLM